MKTQDKHPLHLFRYCPECGSPRFVENNVKSKRCQACGFVYYFNPSAATVALIENERGEWCVVRRAKEPARGTLDLPGGFCDLYETSEEGVAREVLEETGLRVASTEFLFSLPNEYVYSGFTVHTMDLFYRCRVADAGALSRARAADDAAELQWVHPSRLRPGDFGLRSVRRGVERLLSALQSGEAAEGTADTAG